MNKFLMFFLITCITFSCRQKGGKAVPEIKFPPGVPIARLYPEIFTNEIPHKLNENSGIIWFRGLIWTFNDSGGKNIVYAINNNGKIIKEVELAGADNHDWEDITQDQENIYIGDFGNNYGIRKNQCIYYFNKKLLTEQPKQRIKPEKIYFQFSDQKDFGFKFFRSVYDCEAMTEFNGQLYLFTKDWQTQTTTVYRLPVKPGSYVAIKEEKFNSSGLIAGADISPDKTKLALIGYNRYSCFIWLFNLNEPGSFFKGDKTFCYFPSIRGAQTEGICFKDNNTLLISNEKSKNYKPEIFEIKLDNNFH